MKDHEERLSKKEQAIINTLGSNNDIVPDYLDKRIMQIAQQEINKNHNKEKILMQGNFFMMAAADEELTAAVELFDEKKYAQIKIFEPRNKVSPYFIKMAFFNEAEQLLTNHRDYKLVITQGERELLRDTIMESTYSGFIPQGQLKNTAEPLNYRILSEND